MTKDDFFSLKEGDKVKLSAGDKAELNTILTRNYSWLDDDFSLCFTFGDDFAFFLPSEVEEIKE